MKTLDILIPHFEDPAGLALSLASIADQTWDGNMHVIVADDGSCADVLAEVERIVADADMSISLLRSQQNSGRPKTRNKLLHASTNEYIAWLDAGDVWYPEKIKTQFARLEELLRDGADTDRLWVTCNYDWQWVGQRPRKIEQTTEGDQLKSLLLGDNLRAYLWTLLGSAKAFRMAGMFDEDLPRLQDLDYFIRFVRAGGEIVNTGTDAPLCRYHKSDVGRNAAEILACNKRIFSKNKDVLDFHGKSTTRRVWFKAYNVSARYAFNNRSLLGYGKYKLLAVLRDPRYAAYRLKRKLSRS